MLKHFHCKYLVFFYFFVLVGYSHGQDSIPVSESQRFVFENRNKRSITMDFKLYNNLMVIPVVINQSDTLHFIFDSGFNSILISDLGMQESLMLNQVRKVQLVGLGEGEPIQAFFSTGNDIKVSGIIGRNQDIFLLTEDIFKLSSKMGRPINGILGHGFFRDFIVEINYNRKKITFHNPERYRYRKRRNSQELPLIIRGSKSYVQATVRQEDHSEVPVLLVVDTGGSHALWLDVHSENELFVPRINYPTLLGTGLSGPVYGKLGRVQSFSIGRHSIKDVIASFPDSTSILNAIGLDGRQGSLGSDILKRFNLIFDYGNQKLTLRPSLYFKLPFYYNPSGIEISNPIPGMPYYVVTDVREDSNAYLAGIRLNDELISIQGNNTNKMTLNDIHSTLQGMPGRNIRLSLKRDGKVYSVKFEMEKVL
jgi:predicted aspartyl protease